MVHMKRTQHGFGALFVILILVIAAAVGAMGWYVYRSLQNMNATYGSATTTSNQAGPKFSSKAAGKNTATLSGVITEGPTSPLSQAGTPSDAPVANHVVQARNAGGKTIASTKTNDQGKYTLHLAPGSYSLVLVPKVGLADPTNNTVQVKPGVNTLNLSVDTGIR